MVLTERIFIRCTQQEKDKIQALAAQNGTSMTEFIKDCCLKRDTPGLSKLIDKQTLEEIIKLRTDIGKTTGMLKKALSMSVYNPQTFADVLKKYSEANTQVLKIIRKCNELL